MITEQDLQAAIAECKGQRNPTSNTCIKLAAYMIIHDHLYGAESLPTYSYAAEPDTIQYNSSSEFSEAINGKRIEDVLPIMDELMETIKALNPRLYAGVMRNLK